MFPSLLNMKSSGDGFFFGCVGMAMIYELVV